MNKSGCQSGAVFLPAGDANIKGTEGTLANCPTFFSRALYQNTNYFMCTFSERLINNKKLEHNLQY